MASLRRGVRGGPCREGSMAYDEVKRPSEGVVGKGLRKRIVGERGARTFIHVESGGWPVHAPCPKQEVAKPGGADRSTEIIRFLKI